MYVITKAVGDGTNEPCKIKDFPLVQEEFGTFERLAKTFKLNEEREKTKQNYFLRGAATERGNKGISETNLLILDGDSGIDGPLDVIGNLEAILNQGDLEYCIYASHSNNSEHLKFRCIIPVDGMMTKDELPGLTKAFCYQLNELGYNIKYASESGSLAQLWFYGSSANPYYKYHKGDVFTLESLTVKAEVVEDKVSGDSATWQEHMQAIQEGNYHPHITPYIMALVKDGMDKAMVIAHAETVMDSVPESLKDDRWQTRRDDIPRSVEGAMAKIDSDNLDDLGLTYEAPVSNEIPRPPGMLGDLMDLAYGQQIYPHEAPALVSALGLVAGIAGRKFNVDSMDGVGLNIYMMLAADSGVGKESIKKFIQNNIPAPDGAVSSSFVGPSNFTAATGLIKNYLKDARCMISVMGEMGYILQSEVGDKAGKRRVMLELYTSSGHNDVLLGTAFSSAENAVPSLNSPCFSCIGESTPNKLIENLVKDDSISDGWLPRFSVFRILNPSIRANKHTMAISADMLERIRELADTCSQIQAVPTFECHMIDHYDRDDMFEHQTYWRGQQIELAGVDQVKSAMSSRLHVKALKYAGLATVFNKGKHEANCLLIEATEWNWAKQMVQYEWETMANFFQGTFTSSPLDDAAARVFGKYILIAMDQKNKSNKKLYDKMDPGMRKDKVIPVSILRQITANQLTKFNDKYNDGFDAVLNYMIKEGYVIRDREYTNTFSARSKDVLRIKQAYYFRLEGTYAKYP